MVIYWKTNMKKVPKGCMACKLYRICGTNKKLTKQEKNEIPPLSCPLNTMEERRELTRIINEYAQEATDMRIEIYKLKASITSKKEKAK